jgi:hypothetical protein
MYTTSKTTACTSDELHVMTENDLSAGVGKEHKGIKESNWNRYLAKEREDLISVNFA